MIGCATGATVSVPPFATAYASRSRAGTTSVASVEGILLRALVDTRPELRAPDPDAIRVVGDETLVPAGARVELVFEDRPSVVCSADGDTRSWSRTDVERHVANRAGARATSIVGAVHALVRGGSIADVLAAWEDLV
jgi:hypothetical protein